MHIFYHLLFIFINMIILIALMNSLLYDPFTVFCCFPRVKEAGINSCDIAAGTIYELDVSVLDTITALCSKSDMIFISMLNGKCCMYIS